MSVRVSGLTARSTALELASLTSCELVEGLLLLTSDAAVADPHQVVSGSLVARHQVVDLGVNPHFLAPCNQSAARANNGSAVDAALKQTHR